MLVVAWKLNAENLGFFKFSEWSKGMGSIQYVISILFGSCALQYSLPILSAVNTCVKKSGTIYFVTF
jgi:hypothetical protein